MDYRYHLMILFKSGNLWEVGVPTKELGLTFARMLVRDNNDVELLTLSDERTGKVKTINYQRLMN